MSILKIRLYLKHVLPFNYCSLIIIVLLIYRSLNDFFFITVFTCKVTPSLRKSDRGVWEKVVVCQEFWHKVSQIWHTTRKSLQSLIHILFKHISYRNLSLFIYYLIIYMFTYERSIIVFRTLLKSVFAILNRYDWLCVWVLPASPSLRVGVLKSPKCPVIRTKMSGIFP